MGQKWKEGLITAQNPILVRTQKYDGVQHRSWPARLLKYEPPLLVLAAQFNEDIEHDFLGTISSGTLSTEYYWLDRWYNVFRFSEPDHQLKSFYCNVNMPPTFNGDLLSYVDLDVDILVQPDLTYQVLDLDDYESNADLYSYPAEVRTQVKLAVEELIRMIDRHTFPFDLQ